MPLASYLHRRVHVSFTVRGTIFGSPYFWLQSDAVDAVRDMHLRANGESLIATWARLSMSVPVVEISMTSSRCGVAPLRFRRALTRKYGCIGCSDANYCIPLRGWQAKMGSPRNSRGRGAGLGSIADKEKSEFNEGW